MTADDDNDRTVVHAGAAGSLRPGVGAALPAPDLRPDPASDPAPDPARMAPTLAAEGAGAAAIAEVAAVAVEASSGADAGDELPVGTRLGEFEITALVGQGGFGIVYEATDHSLGRRVALKEYMPSALAARYANSQVQVRSARYREAFEAGRKSFVNEARLLASFDHPALVKVYRFWEGNGTAYMAMQFLEGRTLQQMLREHRRAGLPPPDEAWLRSVLAPLTEALLVIHAQQCYHRDIAPDNVMQLTNGRWLLLDFGAARRVIGDLTQALTVILKPGYAPIEQYAEAPGMKQGAWTDVYALAAVVYYAIVGKTLPPSVSRMLDDTYVPLAQAMAGQYSDAFLSAIDRALAVRPEQRTQSIEELRLQLGLGEPTIDPF
ncbi:MAG TPA: serine/threonine-protein kinase, partial [Rubrivivax sp.]|nr:serine/threonine-protein kinase [Rubrivivax sp.]